MLGLRAGVAEGPALASGPFWKAESARLAGGLGIKEEGLEPLPDLDLSGSWYHVLQPEV